MVGAFQIRCIKELSRDRVIGGLIFILSILVILVYGWLLFFTEYFMIALQVTAFIAVAGILAILAWIGYTLATTPPPKPIEEVEKELTQQSTDE
jgi:predicted DNA-binding transcriptional regulator